MMAILSTKYLLFKEKIKEANRELHILFPKLEKIKGGLFASKKRFYLGVIVLDLILMVVTTGVGIKTASHWADTLVSPIMPLHPLTAGKEGREVMGFAPYWNFDSLGSVDFESLTTLAYFGVPVGGDGNLDRSDQGYTTFKSRQATSLFKKAHLNGSRVVLTITQMKQGPIFALLDDPNAQQAAIDQTVSEVEKRGIDGINVDFEYGGDPGPDYRTKFANFIANLTAKMHQENPASKVTVSVYATSVKEPKLYDIAALSKSADGIFMMAYDFATVSSDTATPTAPLYGFREGKYWYDVSTAVNDFLTQMPASKLILGIPWYGINYLVYDPSINAETRPYYSWRGQPVTQPYTIAADSITPAMDGITDFKTGWDDIGKVAWKAYYVASSGTWRMLLMDDVRSLGLKYDFAKSKNLAGVGVWALGYDNNKPELWNLLKEKFGLKLADSSLVGRVIASDETD